VQFGSVYFELLHKKRKKNSKAPWLRALWHFGSDFIIKANFFIVDVFI
jgi:hypothetical protein